MRRFANQILGRRLAPAEPLSALLAAPAEDPLSTHGAAWLVLLRWVAVVGQLVTIAVVRFGLGVDLPLGPLLAAVAATGLSNLALAVWSSTRSADDEAPGATPSDRSTMPVLELVLLLDLLLLTILLAYSGGPANPFFIFYFVNLCLSAVVLPRGWAWVNTAAAAGCFTCLFFFHRPLPSMWAAVRIPPVRPGGSFSPAEWGLLVAFVTCAGVVVYFTSLLRDQLRKRERQVEAFQIERARTQKLEALGTLAAGAAHELANPLGTIAVVAREVERRVAGTPAAATVVKDIALIRSELDTCRNILKRMSAEAGQAMGERLVEVAPAELIDETLDGLQNGEDVAVSVAQEVEDLTIRVPLVGLAQAIRGIVQNAMAASDVAQRVLVAADRVEGRLRLVVRDEGIGMPAAVLARVGDPFFTTKEPGHGTGLGVFLARAVVERLGGKLSIDSAPGRGTTVTILLPLTSG